MSLIFTYDSFNYLFLLLQWGNSKHNLNRKKIYFYTNVEERKHSMKKHVLFSSIPKLLNQTDSSLPIADKLQIGKGTAAKKGKY